MLKFSAGRRKDGHGEYYRAPAYWKQKQINGTIAVPYLLWVCVHV